MGTGDAHDMRTLVDGCLVEVTDGCGLDHVADSEALDGLVLGDGARAVGAAHELGVAAAVLVAAVVATLLGLQDPEFGVSIRQHIRRRRRAM